MLKILKPVEFSRVKREVMVLMMLQGGPNIVELIDVVKDPQSPDNVTLVFEYINTGSQNAY